MKKKKEKLDVVFLLDRSGSMRDSASDTISSYNEYLEREKEKDALLTTVLFDDKYEILHFRENISNVKPITKNQYYVRGCTALYDAIGKTISMIDAEKPNKVLFVIITDGLENASSEYNKKDISKLIKEHGNFEFIYLGANIDSYAEGGFIGIKKNRISNYSKTSEGIGNIFKSMAYISECMMEDKEINENWKNDL